MIFGNANMSLKLEAFDLEKKEKKLIRKQLKIRSCKDYLFIEPEGTLYSIFDPIMTLAIFFTCITSAYYASFGQPENAVL